MTPHELARALVLLVLSLPFLAVLAHAEPPPPELGVSVTRASDCSGGCWRLVSLDYKDENESAGLHHAFAILRDEAGRQIAEERWTVAWDDGAINAPSKPAPNWSDIALWSCYDPAHGSGPYRAFAGVVEARSDTVHGLGLPLCHHVSFYMIWQWQPGGAVEQQSPRLWLPLVRSE